MKDRRSELTAADVVVKVEQDGEQDPERERNPDPFAGEFPEPDEPFPSVSRQVSRSSGEGAYRDLVESTPVRETGGGDDGEGHTVVCEDAAHDSVQKGGLAEPVEEEGHD